MADQGMPTTYETQTTSRPAIGFHKEYVMSLPGILKIAEIVLSLITFICGVSGWWWSGGAAGWVNFVCLTAFFSTLIFFIFHVIGLYYRFPAFRDLIVLGLAAFCSACIHTWPVPIGQGYAIFAIAAAFLFTLAYFMLHTLKIFARHPGQALPVVLCTIVFICSVSALWSGQGWVEFVCLSAVLSTIALFVMHLLNVISRLPGPWKLIEFVYYCVFTGMFIIAAIVAAAQASNSSSAVGACAFFAFAATAVYAVDTFFQFRAWRSGQTEMSTHTTTTTGNPEAAKTTY